MDDVAEQISQPNPHHNQETAIQRNVITNVPLPNYASTIELALSQTQFFPLLAFPGEQLGMQGKRGLLT